MPATQQELALQMIAQLRMLDPSVSADLGTPERKLLDTFAQGLADAQIDLVALQGALDLDSKYGDNLDRFLALFGFARRQATYATGFATFSRITPSTVDIRVPIGTQVRAIIPNAVVDQDTVFSTTFDVVLPAGDLEIVAPIRSNLPGATGDVGAGTITQFVNTTVYGITSVTNVNPTTGGGDSETDEEFKARFKNQVFRNLAGTQDQYLALAAATAFTTKANVIGPISRYQEYIQVPSVDDATGYDVNNDGVLEAGGGVAGEYTSALSDVPYSKYTYTSVPYYVSNGRADALAVFYRPDVDFRMNTTTATKNAGDTRRESSVSPLLGYQVTDPRAAFQPNVTFLNIYTGTNDDVQAIRPSDVVLFEHSYLSSASRNDVANGVTNAVDVFIDGGNDTVVTSITTRPSTAMVFVNNTTSKFHYDNYRRAGEPEHRPILGNVLLPLFWEPVTDLPSEIVVGTATYKKGIHYWPIQDVSTLQGTIRARSGVEFSTSINGITNADDEEAAPGTWTGPIITAHPAGTTVPVEDYTYDKNIADLQAILESNKQVTTDVLAHKAKMRYFKLDVSLSYQPGIAISDTNVAIQTNVQNWLGSTYFGQVIQLSDLLQAIHTVPGVDNVRWSSDIPGGADLVRVYETDVNGNPLTGLVIDQLRPGTAAQSERFQMYYTGAPTGGSFTLFWDIATTTVNYGVSASTLQATLRTLTGASSLTVTGSGTLANPFIIDFVANGTVLNQIDYLSALTGGDKIFMADFFLKDDELASLATGATLGDTVAGLIIRPRAQNTFTRS